MTLPAETAPLTPTTPAAPAQPKWMPLRAADLRGLARLGVDATLGLTDLVEAMHHTIGTVAAPLGPAKTGRTRGLTGWVYRTVRGTTRVVGQGADALLGGLLPAVADGDSTPERDALIAALNGLFGDHLADTGNPLALPMTVRVAGRALDLSGATPIGSALPQASGHVLVLAHGLCMHDGQWLREATDPAGEGHDHGQALARALGASAVYLRYNSGRHVSQNGRDLAGLLDALVAHWPVPVQRLTIVGHSMGGLVARSACHVAQQQGLPWLARLRELVCLGTPHQGAPLERGGRLVDAALGLSPYAAPFARLGKARSAGITDLRYGNLQDADWQGRDRHAQRRDDRQPTPLPAGVNAYLVAATTAEDTQGLRHHLIGDGLVPLASALGRHRRAALALTVPDAHQFIATRCNHFELLGRADVQAQMLAWLRAAA